MPEDPANDALSSSEPDLVSSDPDSPIRRISFLDEDWAVVTILQEDGSEREFLVTRRTAAERVSLPD